MMFTLLSALFTEIEGFFFSLFVCLFLSEQKIDRQKRYRISAIVFGIYFLLSFPSILLLQNHKELFPFLNLLYLWAAVSIGAKGTLSKRLPAVCFSYLLIGFSECAFTFLLTFINTIFPAASLPENYIVTSGDSRPYIIGIIPSVLLLSIVYRFLYRFTASYSHLLNIKVILPLLLPIGMLFIILIIYTSSSFTLCSWSIVTAIISVILLPSYIIFFKGIRKITKLEQTHLKSLAQKEYLQQTLDHFHQTEYEYKKIYKWNHDFKNHMLAVSCLLDKECYSEAADYIHQLLDKGDI